MDGPYLSASRSWAVKLSSDPESLGMFWGAAAARRERVKRPAMKLIMALVDMIDFMEVAVMRVNIWIGMILWCEIVLCCLDA